MKDEPLALGKLDDKKMANKSNAETNTIFSCLIIFAWGKKAGALSFCATYAGNINELLWVFFKHSLSGKQ